MFWYENDEVLDVLADQSGGPRGGYRLPSPPPPPSISEHGTTAELNRNLAGDLGHLPLVKSLQRMEWEREDLVDTWFRLDSSLLGALSCKISLTCSVRFGLIPILAGLNTCQQFDSEYPSRLLWRPLNSQVWGVRVSMIEKRKVDKSLVAISCVLESLY